jgi:hypothetical protein
MSKILGRVRYESQAVNSDFQANKWGERTEAHSFSSSARLPDSVAREAGLS